MAENLGKWPSKPGRSPKSGYRMAAEGMQDPWRWIGGTISLNLGVIWEMSGKMARARPESPIVLRSRATGRGEAI